MEEEGLASQPMSTSSVVFKTDTRKNRRSRGADSSSSTSAQVGTSEPAQSSRVQQKSEDDAPKGPKPQESKPEVWAAASAAHAPKPASTATSSKAVFRPKSKHSSGSEKK